jgi:DNA helicase II / ATP-dependent DNA helicase PcrA
MSSDSGGPFAQGQHTLVHWFRSDGVWWVCVGATSLRFSDRAEAFEAAKELARRTSPSRLTSEAPMSWSGVAIVPVAPIDRPVVRSGSVDWKQVAGPRPMGRSLLVSPRGEAPIPWDGCERVAVTTQRLSDSSFLAEVRDAFLVRRPVVYELEGDVQAPTAGVRNTDTWDTPVDFDFVMETTWTLITRNAVNARSGAPVWELSDRAIALGATPGQATDVLLPNGRAAWCDGGAMRLWAPDDLDGGMVAVVPIEAIEVGSLAPLSTNDTGADLANDQLDAVIDPEMRSRIIAPAGSGKTRVLTERARHLLHSSVPAASLTLVAFNKRAQLEIVDRTRDLPGLQVQTLNALALAILNGSKGFKARGSRVDTVDELFVRELLDSLVRFPRRANTDPAASWIDALSSIRLGLRSPRVVEEEFGGDVEGLSDVFPRYRSELSRRGAVDFDEQIYLCLEVLLNEPEVRLQAQRHCRLLLVDEFQDLTPAHMLLLRLLAGPTLSIFGVGDDDQSIYGYSGASPRWLVDYDAFIPSARHHALTVNYRCPTPVVTATANLLSRNRNRVQKAISAGPNNTSAPTALRTLRHELPTAATMERVRQLLGEGTQPSEIAVLTRVNSMLAPVHASLVEEGIPVQLRDGLGFLSRTGVAAAIAWLRLAVAPTMMARSDLSLAARRPSRGISPRVIEWIGEQSDVVGIQRLASRISDDKSANKVGVFASDLQRAQQRAKSATTSSLLEFTSSEIGLARSMATLDESHIGRNSQAHSDDLRALIALGHVHPDPVTFPAWLARTLSSPNSPGGITLATVHKVKGLEWPHVIVHDATSGLFPHRLSTDIEEERRVFHVAITRARQSLTIVADLSNPSMFLDELEAPQTLELQDVVAAAASRGGAAPIEATDGLAFRWGGYECTIQDSDQHHVTVAIGTSTITIPFGSEVIFEGSPRLLVAPLRTGTRRDATADESSVNPAVFDALKAWRLERSRKDKVPAFVVASDRTLLALAAAMPTNEAQLLDVHGIGATKMELYGDEIVTVLDSVRPSVLGL